MRGLKLKGVVEEDFPAVQPENPLREYFSGFPSPAEDFREGGLDLNRLLVSHPSATFFARVEGDEFHNDCIDEDDLLIIDRSIKPYHGCMAVCVVNEEFTLRKVYKKGEVITLVTLDGKNGIELKKGDESVWGVVSYWIKNARHVRAL